ncbi:MAG: type II toxin-antitoxin system PrlF family antitoxin [Deltaproteobacteria bacterium]
MPILEEVSTITAKGQTTVPKAVRQLLGIDCGGQVAFRVEDGQVTLHPVGAQHEDPVVGRFLDFLAKDLERHPEAVVSLSRDFVARVTALTKGKRRVDVAAPIEGPVDL